MDIGAGQIWIIITILLLIAEIFLPTFLASCLAIGSLLASLFASMGVGFEGQIIAFSIGTLIGFFGVRPFMIKYAHKNSNKVKTNMDRLVGKVGRVAIAIDNSKGQGRVTVDGDDWRAETENHELVNVGESVEIISINSTILIVKPITKI